MTDIALVVRRAESDDWPKLRAIRLEALGDSPEAFGSTYAVAAKLSNYQWRAMIERSLYFLAERDGDVVGHGLGRVQRPPPRHALAVRHVRHALGTGLSDRALLVDAVVEWARGEGATELYLHVTSIAAARSSLLRARWDSSRPGRTSGWTETPGSS